MKFCSLFSGSSGNCNYIGTGNAGLLVDVGLSGIKIQNEMKKNNINPIDIDGIIITHEHIDHVQGVGVFSRRFDIPVYASVKTWEAMACKVGKIKEDNRRFLEPRSDRKSPGRRSDRTLPVGLPIGETVSSGNQG